MKMPCVESLKHAVIESNNQRQSEKKKFFFLCADYRKRTCFWVFCLFYLFILSEQSNEVLIKYSWGGGGERYLVFLIQRSISRRVYFCFQTNFIDMDG